MSEPAPSLPWEFSAPIATPRLRLRLMTADDTDDVLAWMSDPEVTRYQLYEPRDRADVARRVLEYSEATTIAAVGDYVQPAIELPDGRVVGAIYFTLTSLDDSAAEIGWALNGEFHGQGYAFEAASAMLDLAFGAMGLHRVCAELDPRNDASVALCLRLGMRHEAHLVEDLWFKGAWGDTGCYAILAREWRERR